jgi:uncharacterized membrane protein YgaE (UPF0421/DUF939 family)
MDAKLTLKLDRDIIAEVKRYAQKRRTSLSKMVENYFKSLVGKEHNRKDKYSPLVKELSGIIKLDQDYDFREDYTDYLIEKYQ